MAAALLLAFSGRRRFSRANILMGTIVCRGSILIENHGLLVLEPARILHGAPGTPSAYIVRDQATTEPVGIGLTLPQAVDLARAYGRACFVDRFTLGVARDPHIYDSVFEFTPDGAQVNPRLQSRATATPGNAEPKTQSKDTIPVSTG